MFVLGHMGVGSKLVQPLSHGLPRRFLFLGTILPDLIDKPLYYGLVLATGKRQAELGLICGTRTFGHTALLLLSIAAVAWLKRSRALAAVALGVATHLLIDVLGDRIMHPENFPSSAQVALLWPFLKSFVPIPFESASEHLRTILNPWVLGGEIVGALILAWDGWKSWHQGEIFADLRERRLARRRMKALRRSSRLPSHPR